MPKKENATIDDLAGMMQREFLTMGKRFDGVDKRIDNLEKKMDKGFALIDERFVELENRMTELESRMSNLEQRMGGLEGRMDSQEESNQEIIERLGRIEQLVDEDYQTRIKRLEDSMRRVYEQLALKK
jgi:uncharacterized coiled-coil protein SlyX